MDAPSPDIRINVDAKQLKSILKVMRSEGCVKLEMPELKVEMVPEALLPKTAPTETASVAPEMAIPSQEEIDRMVFWSAPQVSDDVAE